MLTDNGRTFNPLTADLRATGPRPGAGLVALRHLLDSRSAELRGIYTDVCSAISANAKYVGSASGPDEDVCNEMVFHHVPSFLRRSEKGRAPIRLRQDVNDSELHARDFWHYAVTEPDAEQYEIDFDAYRAGISSDPSPNRSRERFSQETALLFFFLDRLPPTASLVVRCREDDPFASYIKQYDGVGALGRRARTAPPQIARLLHVKRPSAAAHR